MQKYSPIILRIGLSLVVVWFGTQQLLGPEPWTALLPAWTVKIPLNQITLIYLHGWFEVISGTLLLLGFYTRIIALMLTVSLFSIVLTVGYGPTGVRDFGLAMAMLSIFLHGKSDWSLDNLLEKHAISKNFS